MSTPTRPPAGASTAGMTIGAVARAIGVSEETLRTWERRYGVLTPERTSGRQRRYSPSQIELLRSVVRQVNDGVRPAAAFAELDAASSDRSRGPDGGLVLVGERTQVAADLLASPLRRAGHAAITCIDASTIEACASESRPAVSIVELLWGDGSALCERLQRITGRPVIAISGLDDEQRALDAGAARFLLKPVPTSRLLGAVAELCAPERIS